MSFKKATRTAKNALRFVTRQNASLAINEAHSVLINATKISVVQFALMLEVQAYYAAFENNVKRSVFTRKELRDAHTALRNKRAAMYFVSKNIACKIVDSHNYNIAVLSLSASAIAQIRDEIAANDTRNEYLLTATLATAKLSDTKSETKAVAVTKVKRVRTAKVKIEAKQIEADSSDDSFERECEALDALESASV